MYLQFENRGFSMARLVHWEGNLILCLKWVVQPTTTLRIARDLTLLIPKPGEKQGQTVFFWGGGSQLILREDMLQKMIVHIGKHGETLFKKHTVELNEGDQVAVLPLESQLTASINTLVHTPVGREEMSSSTRCAVHVVLTTSRLLQLLHLLLKICWSPPILINQN